MEGNMSIKSRSVARFSGNRRSRVWIWRIIFPCSKILSLDMGAWRGWIERSATGANRIYCYTLRTGTDNDRSYWGLWISSKVWSYHLTNWGSEEVVVAKLTLGVDLKLRIGNGERVALVRIELENSLWILNVDSQLSGNVSGKFVLEHERDRSVLRLNVGEAHGFALSDWLMRLI